MEGLDPQKALAELWRLVRALNKYIDETEPWALARRPETAERLDTVLYHALETLRIIALLIGPFLPQTGRRIWEQLGLTEPFEAQKKENAAWGGLPSGLATRPGDPLFPRIDVEEALAEEEGDGEPAGARKTIIGAPIGRRLQARGALKA